MRRNITPEQAIKDYNLTTQSYAYDMENDTYVDLWKYDNPDDAGLDNEPEDTSNWRYVTEKELQECVYDCLEPFTRCPHCSSLFEPRRFPARCPDCHRKVNSEMELNWEDCFGGIPPEELVA